MKKYKVVWKIEIEKTLEADNPEEAMAKATDTDCQHDGEYISGSWEILKIEKV